MKTRQFLRFIHDNNNYNNQTSSDWFSLSVLTRSLHYLYHIVTNFSEICAFIIGLSFTVWTKKSAKKSTVTSRRMLTKFVSIGSYSPQVRSFGTLITSTKVFSLIICKTL